jgi:hypothetical protein
MESYNGGAGAQPQTPPPTDPNPTRYIPPEERPTGYEPYAPPTTPQASPEQARSETPRYGNGQAAPPPQYNYPAPPPTYTRAPVTRPERDRTMLALILIGGGILFLFAQLGLFPGFGNVVLLLIGGVFLYAYFTTKPAYRIGFLIPGSILTGLGVGVLLENAPIFGNMFGSGIVPLFLGLGFVLIWFFERRHWWALIPGGVMILAGLSSVLRIGALWPIVLVILGVYLLYDQWRRQPRT